MDAWKKRIEEIFNDDSDGKIIAIIDSLRLNNPKLMNITEKKNKIIPWKEAAVVAAYELIQKDIETIANALE